MSGVRWAARTAEVAFIVAVVCSCVVSVGERRVLWTRVARIKMV